MLCDDDECLCVSILTLSVAFPCRKSTSTRAPAVPDPPRPATAAQRGKSPRRRSFLLPARHLTENLVLFCSTEQPAPPQPGSALRGPAPGLPRPPRDAFPDRCCLPIAGRAPARPEGTSTALRPVKSSADEQKDLRAAASTRAGPLAALSPRALHRCQGECARTCTRACVFLCPSLYFLIYNCFGNRAVPLLLLLHGYGASTTYVR